MDKKQCEDFDRIIDAIAFHEKDVAHRDLVIQKAQAMVHGATDKEIDEILCLEYLVPVKFMQMRREYYEGVRLEKKRRVAEKYSQLCVDEKWSIMEEVPRALVEIDWNRDFSADLRVENVAKCVSKVIRVRKVDGFVVIDHDDDSYDTGCTEPGLALRLLANQVQDQGYSHGSQTFLWPDQDEIPWFRNEVPNKHLDIDVEILIVTDNSVQYALMNATVLHLTSFGRRAYYFYDEQDYEIVRSAYPWSDFGLVVRDDGNAGTLPLFGRDNGRWYFSRVDPVGKSIEPYHLMSRLSGFDGVMMRMIFFRAIVPPSFKITPTMLEVIITHEAREGRSVNLISPYTDDTLAIYVWSDGTHKIILKEDLYDYGSVCLVTDRRLYQELRSTENPSFSGNGTSFDGLLDVSALYAEGLSFREKCRLTQWFFSSMQGVPFFFYGDKIQSQRNDQVSLRPDSALWGPSKETEWEMSPPMAEMIMPYSPPGIELQDLPTLFLVLASVLVAGVFEGRTIIPSLSSDVRPFSVPGFEYGVVHTIISAEFSAEMQYGSDARQYLFKNCDAVGFSKLVQWYGDLICTARNGFGNQPLSEMTGVKTSSLLNVLRRPIFFHIVLLEEGNSYPYVLVVQPKPFHRSNDWVQYCITPKQYSKLRKSMRKSKIRALFERLQGVCMNLSSSEDPYCPFSSYCFIKESGKKWHCRRWSDSRIPNVVGDAAVRVVYQLRENPQILS